MFLISKVVLTHLEVDIMDKISKLSEHWLHIISIKY